jgi:hypothetical protein
VTTGDKMLNAALAYAEHLAWPVFPLAPKSKIPLFSRRDGGKGLLDATREAERIHRWWSNRRDANIGVATGTPSGFFVVDVDPRNGGDETLRELERQHEQLPQTVIGLTGGGGRHLLFKHVAGIRNSAGRLGAGVDVRADGGYIVAPPSVHENGRLYEWDVDRHPGDVPVADAPAWLIELAGTPPKSSGATLPESWRRLVADGAGEGARNEAVARLAGHLLGRRVDALVALDLCRCWNAGRCRPPLADNEVVRRRSSAAAMLSTVPRRFVRDRSGAEVGRLLASEQCDELARGVGRRPRCSWGRPAVVVWSYRCCTI